MKKRLLAASIATLALIACHSGASAASPAPPGASARTQAAVQAVQAFLQTLSPSQREQLQFDFAPHVKAKAATFKGGMNGRMDFVGEQYGKAVWSNYPVSDVPRPGLALGKLSSAQRQAAMHVLQSVLSTKGYEKVLAIMGSDQALSETGTKYASGAAYYTIGIFGKPDASSPWMIEFGGHHLGLNVVIAGTRGTMTPTLTGAQPAVYQHGGKTVRVLAQENDKAFDLLAALTPAQRKQAVLDYAIGDLVLGPGHDGEVIVPEGVKGSALDARQRAMLLDLIDEWAGIIDPAYTGPRMAELRAGLDETYFAWSGPQTHVPGRNGAAYYRIQGPKVLIEFAPQAPGGDVTMHVHTVYRDPTESYGRALATP
jgi:hypothetical protein